MPFFVDKNFAKFKGKIQENLNILANRAATAAGSLRFVIPPFAKLKALPASVLEPPGALQTI